MFEVIQVIGLTRLRGLLPPLPARHLSPEVHQQIKALSLRITAGHALYDEASPLGILGRNDPLAGCTQLACLGRDLFEPCLQFDREPNTIERGASLRGQIGQQPLVPSTVITAVPISRGVGVCDWISYLTSAMMRLL